RRKLHIAEPLLSPHHALLNSAQVKVLDLPGRIVAPVTAPHKPEITAGPFTVSVPVLTSGDDGAVVHVPPVRHIETNGAEAASGWCPRLIDLLRDYAPGSKVKHSRCCVIARDQRQFSASLPERLKGLQQ